MEESPPIGLSLDEIMAWSERHALPQRRQQQHKWKGERRAQKPEAVSDRKRRERAKGESEQSEERSAKRRRADEPRPAKEEEHKMEEEEQGTTTGEAADAKRKRPEMQESFVIVRPKGPPMWKVREQQEKERQLKKAKAGE